MRCAAKPPAAIATIAAAEPSTLAAPQTTSESTSAAASQPAIAATATITPTAIAPSFAAATQSATFDRLIRHGLLAAPRAASERPSKQFA